jgi:hypothetical protein
MLNNSFNLFYSNTTNTTTPSDEFALGMNAHDFILFSSVCGAAILGIIISRIFCCYMNCANKKSKLEPAEIDLNESFESDKYFLMHDDAKVIIDSQQRSYV